MKKTMSFGALVVALATTSVHAQSSVEEMLGFTTPVMQAPGGTAETGHASAEESPFYFRLSIDPIIMGATNVKGSTALNGLLMDNAKLRYDLGVGVGAAFGYRIPDTYVFVQVDTGFQWASVQSFDATLSLPGPVLVDTIAGGHGNMYQVPVMVTLGLEFDLPEGWPFLDGGSFRFGPSAGMAYQDIAVSDIGSSTNDRFAFESESWVFSYGFYLAFDFFFSHNSAFTIGYQFIGTSGVDYGPLTGTSGPGGPPLAVDSQPEVKANFTYTNVVHAGFAFFF